MSETKLEQEAPQKIHQVEEAMQHARALGRQMEEKVATMTSSSWLGNQASKFNNQWQQYNEDFQKIVNQLVGVADKGKADMMKIINHDAG